MDWPAEALDRLRPTVAAALRRWQAENLLFRGFAAGEAALLCANSLWAVLAPLRLIEQAPGPVDLLLYLLAAAFWLLAPAGAAAGAWRALAGGGRARYEFFAAAFVAQATLLLLIVLAYAPALEPGWVLRSGDVGLPAWGATLLAAAVIVRCFGLWWCRATPPWEGSWQRAPRRAALLVLTGLAALPAAPFLLAYYGLRLYTP